MRHRYNIVQVSGFFYAVLRRPELANAVRSLTLRGWETRLLHYGDPTFEIPKDTWKYDADLIYPLLLEAMHITTITDFTSPLIILRIPH